MLPAMPPCPPTVPGTDRQDWPDTDELGVRSGGNTRPWVGGPSVSSPLPGGDASEVMMTGDTSMASLIQMAKLE